MTPLPRPPTCTCTLFLENPNYTLQSLFQESKGSIETTELGVD